MAAVPKAMYRSTPSTTAAVTAGTVPGGTQWIVTNIIIMNTSASSALAQVTLNGQPLVYLTLAAGQQYVLDCRQVLIATQVLGVQTSVASALTFHISGVEQGV